MKQINLFFSICLMLICMAGCSGNGPEAVAKDFTRALYGGDAKKAKQYCTPDTQKGLDMMVQVFESDDYKKVKPAQVNVQVDQCELSEDGTEAVVHLLVTYVVPEGGKKEEQTKVNLVKYDGKWMVRFKVK